MNDAKEFEILATSKNEGEVRAVTFDCNNQVIGTVLLNPTIFRSTKVHLVEYAWRTLLQSQEFKVPSDLPYNLRIALAASSIEHKLGVCKSKRSYKLLQDRNPRYWNFISNK